MSRNETESKEKPITLEEETLESRTPGLYQGKVCAYCHAYIPNNMFSIHDTNRGLDYCSKRCQRLFEQAEEPD